MSFKEKNKAMEVNGDPSRCVTIIQNNSFFILFTSRITTSSENRCPVLPGNLNCLLLNDTVFEIFIAVVSIKTQLKIFSNCTLF